MTDKVILRSVLGFSIVTRGGSVGIRCETCKRVSFSPKDRENLYCANCDKFYVAYPLRESTKD